MFALLSLALLTTLRISKGSELLMEPELRFTLIPDHEDDDINPPRAKRQRMQDPEGSTFRVYVGYGLEFMEKLEKRMCTEKDLVIGYGFTQNDKVESYYSWIDSLLGIGTHVLREIPKVENFSDLFPYLLEFIRIATLRLTLFHESLASKVFADTQILCREISTFRHQDMDIKRTQEHQKWIDRLRGHWVMNKEWLWTEQGPQRDVSELLQTDKIDVSRVEMVGLQTVFAFWVSLLRNAVVQQRAEGAAKWEEYLQSDAKMDNLYQLECDILSSIDLMWDALKHVLRMKDPHRFPILLMTQMKQQAMKTLQIYDQVDQMVIEIGVAEIVRRWIKDHNGSIAVVMRKPATSKLTNAINQLGVYEESDRKVARQSWY